MNHLTTKQQTISAHKAYAKNRANSFTQAKDVRDKPKESAREKRGFIWFILSPEFQKEMKDNITPRHKTCQDKEQPEHKKRFQTPGGSHCRFGKLRTAHFFLSFKIGIAVLLNSGTAVSILALKKMAFKI